MLLLLYSFNISATPIVAWGGLSVGSCKESGHETV